MLKNIALSGGFSNKRSFPFIPSSSELFGGGTTDFLSRWTGAQTLGDSIIKQVSGNLGISTTSPLGLVDVRGELFTGASGGNLYTSLSSINCNYQADDDTQRLYINRYGYHGGTTRFRSLLIEDGKGKYYIDFDAPSHYLYIGEEGGTNNTLINAATGEITVGLNGTANLYAKNLCGIGTVTAVGLLTLVSTDTVATSKRLSVNVGHETASSGTFVRADHVYERKDTGTLTDDGILKIINGANIDYYTGTGFAWCSTGYSSEIFSANFAVSNQGGVSIFNAIGAISTNDDDNNFCIYIDPVDHSLNLKNRLGQTCNIGYSIEYYDNN